MSLPNNLAKIKSSGIYRFVYDKSQVPNQVGETLRLVVGFSEKGPFNTPVYINNRAEFVNIFGNVSKRLEKKGIFFHRMALQALAAGPILAFNMKPFNKEHVHGWGIDPADVKPNAAITPAPNTEIDIESIFNTERFWKLDEDKVPAAVTGGKLINVVATDTKNSSCSIFIRPLSPADKKQYDIKTAEWYKNVAMEDLPEYFDGTETLSDYFAEVYVFRGKFDTALCTGALADYFNQSQVSDGVYKLVDAYTNKFGDSIDPLEALAENPSSKFVGRYQGSLIPFFKDANGSYISLDIVFNSDYNNHKMVMKLDEDKFAASKKFSAIGDADWSATWPALVPTYLEGYTYATKTYDDIFGVLDGKGMYTALTNRVDSDYHYIVDTFASFNGDSDNKAKLAAIAKAKDNAFAILNFPAMSQFTDIADAAAWTGKPSEVNGASYCALYTPLVFGDGTVKTVVPSAALVSNKFMEKYDSRQPYYIVAGPTYGAMNYEGLIGPDYNFGRSDLDVLEPAGINAMVFVPRKGTFINSNQTAKQSPITALSKIHVRELVIFLQDEIESMLQDYQWELNTNVLRDNIKAKADAICEKCYNNGGIYAYQNICDESNNTPEVIDNEMIVLDTAIEPARGAGKMVQQLTIHKTGGISTLLK